MNAEKPINALAMRKTAWSSCELRQNVHWALSSPVQHGLQLLLSPPGLAQLCSTSGLLTQAGYESLICCAVCVPRTLSTGRHAQPAHAGMCIWTHLALPLVALSQHCVTLCCLLQAPVGLLHTQQLTSCIHRTSGLLGFVR